MSEHDEIFNQYKTDIDFINYEKNARSRRDIVVKIRKKWNDATFLDHLHTAIDYYLRNCEYLDKKYLDVSWFQTSQGNLIDVDTLYSIFKEIVDDCYEYGKKMTYFYYYGKQYATATPADGLRKLATEKKDVFCWEVKDDGGISNIPTVVSGEMITGITEK